MAGKKGAGKRKITKEASTRKVLFELQASEAKEVNLAGEFNNWDTAAHPMKKDKDGVWKTILSLEPGKYEYRFFIDGRWENDPKCPFCVPNEFGSQNCVRI